MRLEIACHDLQVIFKVVDQGIGISPEDQEHLFEPFHRGQNVGSIPGSGLGLAIVKRLVEILAGQIAVESRPDLGTTFTATFPLDEAVSENGL